jgi:pimeloyl-ACP methyl ester carboxylesterase
MLHRHRSVLTAVGLVLALNAAALVGIEHFRSRFHRTAPLRPGLQVREHLGADGEIYRYSVFVPYSIPANQPVPVILYLNGYGKNGDDGISPLRDGLGPMIWEHKAAFPCVVIFPQCQLGGAWSPEGPDGRRALEILDRVQEELNTDRDRVYVTGLSVGGAATWMFGAAYPERFAAIVPTSANYSISLETSEQFAKAHLPVWAFCGGSNEEPRLLQANRLSHEALLEAGADSRLTVLIDGDHNTWDYAYRNAGFWNWLLQQRRPTDAAVKPSPIPLLHGSLDGWKSSGDSVWELEDEWTVKGAAPSNSPGWLECAVDHLDFVAQLEFNPADADACRILFRGAGLVESREGWICELRRPNSGNGGIFDAKSNAQLIPADPIGERAWKSNQWNDLRIEVIGNTLGVSLNGATVIEASTSDLTLPAVAIALECPAKSEVQYRYVRMATDEQQ